MVALIQSFLVDPQKHIVSVLRSTASAVHQHFADTESIHAIHSVSWKVGVILFHRKRWPCIEANSRDCRTLRTRLHSFTASPLQISSLVEFLHDPRSQSQAASRDAVGE